jgi:hypothetical protein
MKKNIHQVAGDLFRAVASVLRGGKLTRLPKSLKWNDLDKKCAEALIAEFPCGYSAEDFTLLGLTCGESTFVLCEFDDDNADYHLSCLAYQAFQDYEWEILYFEEN